MTENIKRMADKIKRIKEKRQAYKAEAYRTAHFKQVVFTPTKEDEEIWRSCMAFINRLDKAYNESRNSGMVFDAPAFRKCR